MDEHVLMPWRTGRKVGRTIYAQISEEPSEADPLIGMMDTPELASAACEAHNSMLEILGVGIGS